MMFSNLFRISASMAVAGLFSYMFLFLMPYYERNALYLGLLPLGLLLFCMTLLHPAVIVGVILLLRSLLDPVLDLTRTGPQGIGFGALINFLVIGIFCFFLITRSRDLKWRNYHFWGVAFLIVCFLGIFYSPVPSRAIRLVMNFATYGCMLFLPRFLISNTEEKNFWLKFLMIAVWLPALAAIYDLACKQGEGRIQGSFTHPNILAFYLTFAVAVVLQGMRSGLMQTRLIWRNVWFCFLLALLFLLLMTKTRNAWIAGGLFLMTYGMLKDRGLLALMGIVFVGAVFIPGVSERIFEMKQSHLSSDPQALNSFAWRMKLWNEAFPWILEKPFFGYGLASFRPLSEKLFQSIRGFGAHNVYVETLFELGLTGLILLAGFFASIMKAFLCHLKNCASEGRREFVLVICYLASYLVICLADNMTYYLAFNWYFFFFIGIYLRVQEFDHEPSRADIDSHSIL